MMEKLISIIIPIYNAEKYLKATLDSIGEQTYSNYELILVNNESTDDSEDICLQYKIKDNRTRYYKKENCGVSNARNFGLKKATGDYICFVDADDILDRNYLEVLLTNLLDGDNQLACCKYKKFQDEFITEIVSNESSKLKNEDKYELLFNNYGGYLWNKIFIKDIILSNNLLFNEEVCICEDMLFVFNYLKYVNSISCSNQVCYFYRVLNNSLSRNFNNMNWFTIFSVLNKIIEENKLYDSSVYNKVLYMYLFKLYEGKYRLKFNKHDKDYKKQKDYINKKNKELQEHKKVLTNKQLFKLYIYKFFNRIAFKLKFRKESNV